MRTLLAPRLLSFLHPCLHHSATAPLPISLSLSLFLLHLLPRLPFSLAQATTPPLSFSRGLFEHPPRPSSSTTGWFPTSTPLDSSPCLSLSLSSSFSNSPRWHQRPLCSSLDTEERLNANHRAATGPWLFFLFFLSSPRGLICRNGMTHRDASKEKKKEMKKRGKKGPHSLLWFRGLLSSRDRNATRVQYVIR